MMGVQLDCPLGMPTIIRRRQAPQGAAAPPQAQLNCGLKEHAGAHASVFEAAVCAFAHRRRRQAEAAAEATTAALQGLSVHSHASDAAAGAEAEARDIAPGSPPSFEAPTPTAPAATNAVPAVAPTARVRHVGLGKRVSSRRTLFDRAGGSSSSSAEDGSSEGNKSAAAPAAAAVGLQPAAPVAGGCDAGRMLGGVALEMVMSPNRASTRAMEEAAAAAAAPLVPATWAGRKRLRFD